MIMMSGISSRTAGSADTTRFTRLGVLCLVVIARSRSGRPWLRGRHGADRAVMDHFIGVGLLLLVFSFSLHLYGKRLLLDLGLSDTTGPTYQIKAVVKHATEVAGWLLITLGLLRLSLARWRHPGAV